MSTEAEGAHFGLRTRLTVAPMGSHMVELYEDEAFLSRTVAELLVPALRSAGSAVMVATTAPRPGFPARLEADGVDVVEARQSGRLLELDAGETLEGFMIDGSPDPALFELSIRRCHRSHARRRRSAARWSPSCGTKAMAPGAPRGPRRSTSSWPTDSRPLPASNGWSTTCSPPSSPVRVVVGRLSGEVRVTVIDRGAGLDAGDASELFGSFGGPGQGEREGSRTRRGLWIAKSLVEGQGRTISAGAGAGAGTAAASPTPFPPRPADPRGDVPRFCRGQTPSVASDHV